MELQTEVLFFKQVNLRITFVSPDFEKEPPLLTVKGCGCLLHQLLGLIGSQLSPTQQTDSGTLSVLEGVGHRSREQCRGEQKEEKLPAMSC